MEGSDVFYDEPVDVMLDSIVAALDDGIAEVVLWLAWFPEVSAEAKRMLTRLLDLRARATELR